MRLFIPNLDAEPESKKHKERDGAGELQTEGGPSGRSPVSAESPDFILREVP